MRQHDFVYKLATTARNYRDFCPGASQDSPGTSQDCSGTSQDSSGTSQDSPGSSQDSPGTSQDSPGMFQDRPGTSLGFTRKNRGEVASLLELKIHSFIFAPQPV